MCLHDFCLIVRELHKPQKRHVVLTKEINLSIGTSIEHYIEINLYIIISSMQSPKATGML